MPAGYTGQAARVHTAPSLRTVDIAAPTCEHRGTDLRTARESGKTRPLRVNRNGFLLCYFLCCVTVVIAATGVLIGFSISAPERVGHYQHPRPVVERNDKELRVVPKTNHGSPAKNKEATYIDKKGALKRGTNDGY